MIFQFLVNNLIFHLFAQLTNQRFSYKMYRIPVVLVPLFLAAILQLTASHEVTYKSLTFGKDNSSYILMSPDMSPLQEELTICSWIKRMSHHNSWNSHAQLWLSYVASANQDEIVISDTGLYYLLGDATTYISQSLTIGQWHHICCTFSYRSRTKNVYYDGVRIGFEKTPSGRKLNIPGSLMLGQYHTGYGGGSIASNGYFGGEMFQTNIYSAELSSSQIQEMYSQGRCSNYTQNFSDVTFLSWEEILQQDRHGNVTEKALEECSTDHTHPTEEEETTEEEEETTEDPDNSTSWRFLRGEHFYNNEISTDMISRMTGRLDLLLEFHNHTVDDALIKHLEKHHSDKVPGNNTEGVEDSESEEEEETDSLELFLTDNWEFLTDRMFYMKIVTEDLISGMTERLDLLAEFSGHLCDDSIINHLEKHHA